jgi:hypothetical protein
MCSNLCDYKQNFKHKEFMWIHCTCPFVSFILIASKSISNQGRKINMNSDLSWHRCVKHDSMHILMLIFLENMLYWYLAGSLKTWYPNNIGWNPVVCKWNFYWPSTNELDLWVPTTCQVRFAMVFQKKKKKWLPLDGQDHIWLLLNNPYEIQSPTYCLDQI